MGRQPPKELDTRADWTAAFRHEASRHARYGRPASVLLLEIGRTPDSRSADCGRARARGPDPGATHGRPIGPSGLGPSSFRLLMPETSVASGPSSRDRAWRRRSGPPATDRTTARACGLTWPRRRVAARSRTPSAKRSAASLAEALHPLESTSVATRWSSSAAGSSQNPVCTSDGWMIVLAGATSQWNRSARPSARDRARRPGRPPRSARWRRGAGRISAGSRSGANAASRRLVEVDPGPEEPPRPAQQDRPRR